MRQERFEQDFFFKLMKQKYEKQLNINVAKQLFLKQIAEHTPQVRKIIFFIKKNYTHGERVDRVRTPNVLKY